MTIKFGHLNGAFMKVLDKNIFCARFQFKVFFAMLVLAGFSATGFWLSSSLRKDEPDTSAAGSTQFVIQKTAVQTTGTEQYGDIPIHFEPNVGQIDDRVKFLSRGRGYEIFLTDSGASMRFGDMSNQTGETISKNIGMKIAGANADADIAGDGELAGKTNYLVGNDPANWKTGVANFAKVRYREIYTGIDAVFYGNQQKLEYDFVVQPNTDVDEITLEFDGADEIAIDEAGDLILTCGPNTLRQLRPVAYQEIDGQRQEVAVHYEIKGRDAGAASQKIGFQVDEYDHNRVLTIDPVLSYSTYLGGNSETLGTGIAVDANGSAYIAGYTTSTSGFPLVSPFQSQNPGGNAAFVTKLNSAGTAFVYSTYLTGIGLGNSAANSIAVDLSGNAYVSGISQSCNFPTTTGSFMPVVPNCGGNFKGFVVKLNASGNNLSFGTYLSSPDFLFNGDLTGIALDSSNNAYITGWTQTQSFPTTPGALKRTLAPNTQNAFVAKLNASGSSLVYSTFVGINTPIPNTDPFDRANAIAVDSAGSAYITGQTVSQNYPVTSTAFQTFPLSRQDAFVTKLNAGGTGLIYSTYLGGTGDEIGRAIAIDAGGNAYVTGSFDGTNGFPFTPNAFRNGAGENCCASVQNGFLTKINPSGTELVYSTSLGTERQAMSGTGVAVDNTGSVYVVGGQGLGAAYIVNAIQPVSQNNDAFILKMNPAGTALSYSTNLGGVNGNSIGAAIAIDASGAAYVTGSTIASNFPVSTGAAQATKPGGQSNSSFVAKIATLPTDCPAITINPQPIPAAVLGQNYSQRLTATGGTAPYSFSQAPGFGVNNLPAGLTLAADGTISGTPTNTNFRSYIVTVQAVDANGCVGIRTFNLVYAQTLPQLQVSVLGRSEILRGRDNVYTFVYTNNGDVDAYVVPIFVRFPNYFIWTPDFAVIQPAQLAGFPVVDYSQFPRDTPSGDDTIVSLVIPRIRARGTGQVSIKLRVPNVPQYANAQFSIRADIGSPLFDSFPMPTGTAELRPWSGDDRGSFNTCQGDTLLSAPDIADRPNISTACFQSLTNLLYDAIGLVPGANCATRVEVFGSNQGANLISTVVGAANGDSNAAGLLPNVLSGAGVVLLQCALGESPAGRVVAAVNTAVNAYSAFQACVPAGGGDTRNGRVVSSFDPNDKIGSTGVGMLRYLDGDNPLPYVIRFENLAAATAPAQEIVITDQLDVGRFDLATFSFGDLTIGDRRLTLLPNRRALNAEFDLRPGTNAIARISANLDMPTGLITWRFRAINPATGLPPDDPFAGILPPNTTPPRGEGSVTFTVRPRTNLVTGSEIRNRARIVFDANPPIDTPEWLNTIDISTPTSRVQLLPASGPAIFPVNWSGMDTGSGIGSFTIYVSDNGGPFMPFIINTTAPNGTFTGVGGHTYRFYSIARDAVGNQEPPKSAAEATTTVNLGSVSGRVLTPGGVGLRNAVVSMTDTNGLRRTATTSSFGVYQFDNVITGQSFTISVSSKRYRFAPQAIPINGTLTNVDFVGLE